MSVVSTLRWWRDEDRICDDNRGRDKELVWLCSCEKRKSWGDL